MNNDVSCTPKVSGDSPDTGGHGPGKKQVSPSGCTSALTSRNRLAPDSVGHQADSRDTACGTSDRHPGTLARPAPIRRSQHPTLRHISRPRAPPPAKCGTTNSPHAPGGAEAEAYKVDDHGIEDEKHGTGDKNDKGRRGCRRRSPGRGPNPPTSLSASGHRHHGSRP
jgi:hypothetical protein